MDRKLCYFCYRVLVHVLLSKVCTNLKLKVCSILLLLWPWARGTWTHNTACSPGENADNLHSALHTNGACYRVKLEKFGDNGVAVHVLVCERNTVPTPSLCSIHTAKRLGSQGVKLTLSIWFIHMKCWTHWPLFLMPPQSQKRFVTY